MAESFACARNLDGWWNDKGWPGYNRAVHGKRFSSQVPRSQMSWKNPGRKAGSNHTAPICLADRKHCTLPTQANAHLHVDGWSVDGDLQLAELIKCSASDRLGESMLYGSSPNFSSRVLSRHLASRELSRKCLPISSLISDMLCGCLLPLQMSVSELSRRPAPGQYCDLFSQWGVVSITSNGKNCTGQRKLKVHLGDSSDWRCQHVW